MFGVKQVVNIQLKVAKLVLANLDGCPLSLIFQMYLFF